MEDHQPLFGETRPRVREHRGIRCLVSVSSTNSFKNILCLYIKSLRSIKLTGYHNYRLDLYEGVYCYSLIQCLRNLVAQLL